MADTFDRPGATTKVVVATTVALSFISFWRGASIVLSDLASTMFYVGGITEQAIGKSAPWFVLGVMFFGFAVRSIYMESCGMFVRGGVYVVVRDSIGPRMAKLSVSALVVDYILTGPISSVSAGQYLGRLLNELSEFAHSSVRVNPNYFAAVFGVIVTIYFWWQNVKGIHESSSKALRIMQITTVMVVILLIWCPITLLYKGDAELPPPPTLKNLTFEPHSLGWLHGTMWPSIWAAAMLIAFGHSLLAMSGFETLAQIYREIAYPKMKNLKITANIVCVYALMSTGLVSLFAVMIIPDAVRSNYYDNLIGGLAMSLAGPEILKLGFHIFVVIVGALILSGAVNTSIIGANGVLNRVAEDGVLVDWFRKPHKTYGTTSRIVGLITVAQLATIILSRGDVYLLGEAYAFGVVWSFALKGMGVLALRFQRHDQEYKMPMNLRLGKVEIPIGLGVTTIALFLVAIANLFTKKIATIYGVSFTIVLFIVFTISEHLNAKRRRSKDAKGLEEFNLDHQPQIGTASMHARPGCVLVAVRDPYNMEHLRRVLEKTNLRRHDIVVATVRPVSTGAGEYGLAEDQIFSSYEQELFSRVVTLAEKEGKPVDLLVVPATDPFVAMVQAAQNLKASRLVTGVSHTMASEELARRIGLAWEQLPEPRHPFSLEIIAADRPSTYVNLGPHPPRLWPEDVDRLHEIWLRLTSREGFGSNLHHRDVVGAALRRLERELDSTRRDELVDELKKEMRNPPADNGN
ncbi:MAG: APC family permease [Paludibaculum sp.]